MGNVVHLSEYRPTDVESVLEELLESARRGEILGLAFIAKRGPRIHDAGLAGCYRLDPEQALAATFRMERHLMGGPPR